MNAQLKAILAEHHDLLVYNLIHQLAVPDAKHYKNLQGTQLRSRVEGLCTAFSRSVADGGEVFVDHILGIAGERVSEGFELREVHLALRVFEENIWRLITVHIPHEQQVECLAFATGIIGRAKDELAEAYLVLLEKCESLHGRANSHTHVIAGGTDSPPLTEDDLSGQERGSLRA